MTLLDVQKKLGDEIKNMIDPIEIIKTWVSYKGIEITEEYRKYKWKKVSDFSIIIDGHINPEICSLNVSTYPLTWEGSHDRGIVIMSMDLKEFFITDKGTWAEYSEMITKTTVLSTPPLCVVDKRLKELGMHPEASLTCETTSLLMRGLISIKDINPCEL